MLSPLDLPPQPILAGARIILRARGDLDIDDRLVHPIDPEEEDGYGSAWRHGWDGSSHHTREHLERIAAAETAPGSYDWVIEHAGNAVGNARLLVNAEQHCATYSVGLFVAEIRGRGLGRDVTQLILDWAFDRLGAHRVQLEVLTSNQRAIRCYRACGFVREGTRREAELYPDGWKDFDLMAILRADYPASPPPR